MGTTTYVRDYTGHVLSRGSADMTELMAAANALQLPFLSGVDLYDDTVFNRRQCGVVRLELGQLADETTLRVAVRELLVHLDHVERRPHRYLIFNGD